MLKIITIINKLTLLKATATFMLILAIIHELSLHGLRNAEYYSAKYCTFMNLEA
jgi:hypothetical protein